MEYRQGSSENPNKTLEGIKTQKVKEWMRQDGTSENPNKTLEGIKTLFVPQIDQRSPCENPNKTLEGIKTACKKFDFLLF
ncbi:hypothetical protein U27_01437 [Candidatus Vecturithrix granuli]|uniref:Uncharacterized protein n=1 Tax=Vecturithrix granuli TaxID=1499967 RepID=A0A081CAD1_VECG1|nr:hypothetical protein U27_01437 [Candidatus Vecturithrix granuli]